MAKAKKKSRKASRKPARKASRKPARKAAPSKKALESKIAALERKLGNLSKPKPQTQAPPPPPKPQTPPPKPAEKAPPALVYEQWKQVSTKNWNDQKAVVTGYTAASDRYWASLHVQNAPDVPAKNWNDTKAVVTGYTAPGDKYFATRQRMSYHPRNKTFQQSIAGSVSGSDSTQTAPPPPPPPQPQPESQPQADSGNKSKQQSLEDYEKDYLLRLEQQAEEDAAAVEEGAVAPTSKKGALPKGF